MISVEFSAEFDTIRASGRPRVLQHPQPSVPGGGFGLPYLSEAPPGTARPKKVGNAWRPISLSTTSTQRFSVSNT